MNPKKLGIILVWILVALIALSFVKDIAIKAAAQKGVEMVTGLKLRTQSFKVGIFNTLIGIKNLRLFNPKGYHDRVMLDMPEIYVDYNLGAMLGGKIHLTELRLNMKEFVVVKNKAGELNLNSLKVVQAQKEGKPPEEKSKGNPPTIQIDDLELKIGKVIYKDYSQGGSPIVKEFNLNLNERYKNVDNAYALVSLVVVKALRHTAIANLTNFDLRGLEGTISGTLMKAQKVATEVVGKAGEVLKESTKEIGGVAKEAEETLKKAAEGLQGIKLPFGAKKE